MPRVHHRPGPGLLLSTVSGRIQRGGLRLPHDGVQRLRRVSRHIKTFIILNNVFRWIHAQCEGIDGEEYQVLSYLPDSVSYVCK